MRELNAAELLQAWDEGAGMSLPEKTLLLLGKICDVYESEVLRRVSIGDRDALLLQFREWLFGFTLNNVASCPRCGEKVEWETDSRDLHLQSPPEQLLVRDFYLTSQQCNVHFRLPDINDILQMHNPKSFDSKDQNLFTDCILDATDSEGRHYVPGQFCDELWMELEKRMSEEDPQADVRMKIECPCCNSDWEAHFDIVSFLWAEIDHWASRMIREIGLLARSFGWSEKDILNLSSHRRQLYIDMIYA